MIERGTANNKKVGPLFEEFLLGQVQEMRLGSVTKYREKKSLRLTKDRKSTLSTDAGKVVEKGTCDQFVLLSNRSIACHVALSIEEEGVCSSLKSFLPIV